MQVSKQNIKGLVFIGDTFFESSKKNPLNILKQNYNNRIVVANCETVISNNIPNVQQTQNKLVSLCKQINTINKSAIDTVDIFTLTNNHTLDLGEIGLNDTNKYLQSKGKIVIGNKKKHIFFEVSGKKVCIFPCIDFSGKKYSMYSIAKESLKKISDLKSKCDFLIISIHWGVEYADYPSPKQRQLARKMIDNGVDLILGHHPHVFQGMETIKNKRVYYSLGNANFGSWQNKFSKWSNVSLVVDCDLSKQDPVIHENFYLIKKDYSLAEMTIQLNQEAQKRFDSISDKNIGLCWIDWGMKSADVFFKQEQEAFKIRFRKKQLRQYLIFVYWLSRPKTIFLLFSIFLKKFIKITEKD